MKKSTIKHFRKQIMPKVLHGLSPDDKKSLVNLLRMQANYVYYKQGYGAKQSHASQYAKSAYKYMCNSYLNMNKFGKHRVKTLGLRSLTPAQKNNWGLIASSYYKQHMVQQSQAHTNQQHVDAPKNKANIAWHEISKLAHKQSKKYHYYQKHGFPFKYVINTARPKDKVPLAHVIMDKSRINYASKKGYHAFKYQKDLKRNKGYLTPQGLNEFKSLMKFESTSNLNSLGFQSANYIKRYNQQHPHNFSIKNTLSKVSQNEQLHVAQYLNDMSKGYYFGLHGNEKLGNSLIDNGKNAKSQLSDNTQKLAHNIIKRGIKHHTLGNIGFQAHKYVNAKYKSFKSKQQSKTDYSSTNNKKDLSHVNLASKLFSNSNSKPKIHTTHFSKNSSKPTLHPKKRQKKSEKLSPTEEKKRENMFSSLNQQEQR